MHALIRKFNTFKMHCFVKLFREFEKNYGQCIFFILVNISDIAVIKKAMFTV